MERKRFQMRLRLGRGGFRRGGRDGGASSTPPAIAELADALAPRLIPGGQPCGAAVRRTGDEHLDVRTTVRIGADTAATAGNVLNGSVSNILSIK